jgi:hypothetical protein
MIARLWQQRAGIYQQDEGIIGKRPGRSQRFASNVRASASK